jgi:hypothetical protein
VEYISLIKIFLRSFEQVFIIIDALDEAPEKGSIVETVLDLLSLSQNQYDAKSRKPCVKVLLTSREDFEVSRILRHLTYLRVNLHERVHDDVEVYVRMDTQNRILAGKLKLRNKELGSHIQDTIISRAGTYVLMQLLDQVVFDI